MWLQLAACVIFCAIVCTSAILLVYIFILHKVSLDKTYLLLLATCYVTCLNEDNTMVALGVYFLYAYVYATADNLFMYMCALMYIPAHDM